MELSDLEKMTEQEIIEAVSKAVRKVFEECDTADWGGLCGIAVENHPNLTDKQKILRDALSREGRHGRSIKAVARVPGTKSPHSSRASGG